MNKSIKAAEFKNPIGSKATPINNSAIKKVVPITINDFLLLGKLAGKKSKDSLRIK